MKKILITGASGYIGSILYQHLIQYTDKYDVYCTDVVRTNYPCRFIFHDIRHELKPYMLTMDDLPNEFDVIIHLAAKIRVSESVMHPTEYYDVNINGTNNILEYYKKYSSGRFIFASTGAAFNNLNSPYAISKKVSEDIIQEQLNDYTIFRFFNVMGTSYGVNPTNPDGLLTSLIEAKNTGVFYQYGDCTRDFIHVNDICQSIIKAIDLDYGTNSIEHLGTGVGHTVSEVVDIFKHVNQCDFVVKYCPPRPGDIPVSVLDKISPLCENTYNITDMMYIN